MAIIRVWMTLPPWWPKPSPLNPADCASQGLLAEAFVDDNLWSGPLFLLEDQSTRSSPLLPGNCNGDLELHPEYQSSVSAVVSAFCTNTAL